MILERQCSQCIFYIADKKCSVFKKAIPEKIWDGKHNHTKPFDGDNGITFEPLPTDER